MANKPRFYVVWKGRNTGIFNTWTECKAQVDGYPGAQYKSFENRVEAEQAYSSAYADYVVTKAREPEQPKPLSEDDLRQIGKPFAQCYAVDAACSGNPGRLEYRCVHYASGEEVFRQGPFKNGTNNVGEFLAIVHALALFKRRKITAPIYSDSEIAIKWVVARKCRTTLEMQANNAPLFELIERAEQWLLENDYENSVLKWHTEVWGEIPADFGRK